MKRFVLFGAIGMLALASCKKNRTCQCLYTDGDTQDYFIVNETLKELKTFAMLKVIQTERAKSKINHKPLFLNF